MIHINNDHPLSQRNRCNLLGINRSTLFYRSRALIIDKDQVELMNAIQDIYAEHPFMGYRRITVMMKAKGYLINTKRTLRLMQTIGLQALHPKKNLSKRRLQDAVYPYLLINEPAVVPNDVWHIDITYLRLTTGFVYLTALIDQISKRIMGWHISPYLETDSCLKALEMALDQGTKPKIINSDQGCQFTSQAWISALVDNGIKISMDGKGCYLDNIYIERFWRTIKYEEVYLKSYETVAEAKEEIAKYINWYNNKRPHQTLNYQTPNSVYQQFIHNDMASDNTVENDRELYHTNQYKKEIHQNKNIKIAKKLDLNLSLTSTKKVHNHQQPLLISS